MLICEETYEKYFNISQILIKGGNTIKDVLILVPKNELVNTIKKERNDKNESYLYNIYYQIYI